jgi:hypothetical protein
MPLRNVNPGDLITSNDWNSLVTALNAMEVRVAELESGGSKSAPRITQVLPTGVRTVGDEIRIYGSNFDYIQGAKSVSFGNTPAVKFLAGSSDTLLIVEIPDPVEGATEAGATLTMSVGNRHSFTTRAITIKSKPVVVSGGIDFTFFRSRPATPTQNQAVFYDFSLHSTASQNLNVTITPDIQIILPLPPGVNDPGLEDFITVLDSDGTERANHVITLAEGATKIISLRLDLPNNINNTRYSVNVRASAPEISPVVRSLPDQQVGLEGEQPDPTITAFEFSSIIDGDGSFSTDTGGVSGVDGTLTVKRGTTVTIELDTTFAGIPVGTTNNYQLTVAVSPTNGWSASVNPVMQNPLPSNGPGGSVDAYFDITAPSSTNTAIVRFTLTRQGVTTNNTRTLSYRLLTSA